MSRFLIRHHQSGRIWIPKSRFSFKNRDFTIEIVSNRGYRTVSFEREGSIFGMQPLLLRHGESTFAVTVLS